MYQAIIHFAEQFAYEPEIIHGESLGGASMFIAAGMGGSHLAADLLKVWDPSLDIVTHSDYGVPFVSDKDRDHALLIASSYSGNTEETIDAFKKAGEAHIARAVIATGGKLLTLAQKEKVPYVELPSTGIQPRSALGFSFKAFLKIMREEGALSRVSQLARSFNPLDFENIGKNLADRLKGFIPVIYSSTRNFPIAYNWKIKFNESGKIPAFCNVFPELNHNEMTGFDVTNTTKHLSRNFYFIFLKDEADDPRITKRMEVMKKLYKDRGLPAEIIELAGQDQFYKMFSSLITADWAAYHIAGHYGVEAEQIPMVEEFKRLIA